MDIQRFATHRCIRCLQVNSTGTILTDDMEHLTLFPSKEHLSIGTEYDVTYIDQ